MHERIMLEIMVMAFDYVRGQGSKYFNDVIIQQFTVLKLVPDYHALYTSRLRSLT